MENCLSIGTTDNEKVTDDKVIQSYFCYKDWAISLPSAHKRYRLTTVEDLQKHPFYFDVRLTDIPSFKGLESDGVVFVFNNFMNFNEYYLKSSLYIALSRAKHLLYMIAPYSIKQEVERLSKV